MRKLLIAVFATLILSVPLHADTIFPPVYAGSDYTGNSGLVSGVFSDLFGKHGVDLCAGVLDESGLSSGIGLDVGYLIEKAGLEYKAVDRLKIISGGSYNFDKEEADWFVFAAMIKLDF